MRILNARLKYLLPILFFVVASAYGQTRLPRFQDLPVSQPYRGAPAPVRLVSKEAKMFRTVLTRGARKGPNFAGHYTIVAWRSGSSCDKFAVIDARTGDVYFPDFPLYYVPYDPSEQEDVIIKKYSKGYMVGSRLLVAQGSFKGSGVFFYRWEKNRFTLIRSVGEGERKDSKGNQSASNKALHRSRRSAALMVQPLPFGGPVMCGVRPLKGSRL
jgi:hypothetical protein